MAIMTPRKTIRFMAITSAILLAFGIQTPTAHSSLWFTEYVEGSSNNKALEVFNGANSTIDLSTYSIQLFFNGSSTSGSNIGLSGSLTPGGIFILSHDAADASLLALADAVTPSLTFNGDDAVALVNNGNTVDVIGQIGLDPGSEWNSNGVGTQNETLRRSLTVTGGDADGLDTFSPHIEWQTFAIDDFSDLVGGGYTPAPVPAPSAMLLMGTGLVGLAGWRWWSAKTI